MSKAESEINSNDLSVGGERWRDGGGAVERMLIRDLVYKIFCKTESGADMQEM